MGNPSSHPIKPTPDLENWSKPGVFVIKDSSKRYVTPVVNENEGDLKMEIRSNPVSWTARKKQNQYIFSYTTEDEKTFYVCGDKSKVKLRKRDWFTENADKKDVRIFEYVSDNGKSGNVLKHCATGNYLRVNENEKIKLTEKARKRLLVEIKEPEDNDGGDVPDGIAQPCSTLEPQCQDIERSAREENVCTVDSGKCDQDEDVPDGIGQCQGQKCAGKDVRGPEENLTQENERSLDEKESQSTSNIKENSNEYHESDGIKVSRI